MIALRSFVILACLTGCASDPRLNAPENSSRLTLPPPAPKAMRGGIVTVDHFKMAGAPVARVRIPAGTHKVGYRCHDWLYMDLAPELTFAFKGGVDYVLSCGKDGTASVVAE